jgi:hypothetical protein
VAIQAQRYIDTSMLARMKELEQENRRLKRTNVERWMRAEIKAEALEKSSDPILATRDNKENNS